MFELRLGNRILATADTAEQCMMIAIDRKLVVIERYGSWLKKGAEIMAVEQKAIAA